VVIHWCNKSSRKVNGCGVSMNELEEKEYRCPICKRIFRKTPNRPIIVEWGIYLCCPYCGYRLVRSDNEVDWVSKVICP